MKSFIHHNVESVKEASKLLAQNKGKAKAYAGGTDLLGILKDRILPDYPEELINLKTIDGLDRIDEDNKGISIGALTKLSDIANSPIIEKDYKLLVDAAKSIATPNIRNMATIGGNLAQDVRCWYYRYSQKIGGPIQCVQKGGKICNALVGDNRYHSIFGAAKLTQYPCSGNCPAQIDIPSYLNKLKNGDYSAAARILLAYNPIPAITGRVCPAFCESNCNRNEFDESVAINGIERTLGDYILDNTDDFYKPPKKRYGKKVAVVGSGPAGLSAAYYLRSSGCSVTVYDKLQEPGGMLLHSIPPFRLPKEVVRKQIQALENMGIAFKVNTNIGDKITIDELTDRFNAVFLAGGAWKEIALGIKGESLVQSGLEFLNRINAGERKIHGKKIAVIGGGNVAIDVARSLLRLGANPIVMYRRTENEMPALINEVEKAKLEGVEFEFLTLPVEASKADNGGIKLKCARMKLGSSDEFGRPKPIVIPKSEFTTDFDAVIKAIGEKPDTSFLSGSLRQKIRKKSSSASLLGKNIFAGGDFITGSSTVIQAVSSGREGAELIIQLFQSMSQKDIKKKQKNVSSLDESCMESGFAFPSFKETSRIQIPELSVKDRISNIDNEDIPNIVLSEIETEAGRCFNCGCLAVTPSDIGVALVALDAKIITTKRSVDAQRFFSISAMSSTVLEADELITKIEIPKTLKEAKQNFLKFTLRKPVDFAIVSVASVIRVKEGLCTDARIVLGSVGPAPVQAKAAEDFLKGRSIDEDAAIRAGELAIEGAMPLSMNTYKVEIAKALVKRSILLNSGFN